MIIYDIMSLSNRASTNRRIEWERAARRSFWLASPDAAATFPRPLLCNEHHGKRRLGVGIPRIRVSTRSESASCARFIRVKMNSGNSGLSQPLILGFGAISLAIR